MMFCSAFLVLSCLGESYLLTVDESTHLRCCHLRLRRVTRFFYKENRQFCYYSRGSLYETKTWLTKAHNRGLVTDEQFECFTKELRTIGIKLNNYIKSIGKGPKSE